MDTQLGLSLAIGTTQHIYFHCTGLEVGVALLLSGVSTCRFNGLKNNCIERHQGKVLERGAAGTEGDKTAFEECNLSRKMKKKMTSSSTS